MPGRERAAGPDNYWLAIDEAAAALGVSKRRAYELAKSEDWRRTPTRPRGFLMHDVKTTRIRMEAMSSHPAGKVARLFQFKKADIK